MGREVVGQRNGGRRGRAQKQKGSEDWRGRRKREAEG